MTKQEMIRYMQEQERYYLDMLNGAELAFGVEHDVTKRYRTCWYTINCLIEEMGIDPILRVRRVGLTTEEQ